MGFTFKLEKILKTRLDEEKKQLHLLYKQELLLQEKEKRVEVIEEELEILEKELAIKKERGLSLALLQHTVQYAQNLQHTLILAQDEVLQQQSVVGKQRKQTLNAVKERKILENLREKQEKEWRLNREKIDSALLDEIAVQAYKRNL